MKGHLTEEAYEWNPYTPWTAIPLSVYIGSQPPGWNINTEKYP